MMMYPAENMGMPLIMSGSQEYWLVDNNGCGFHDLSFNLQPQPQQRHKLLLLQQQQHLLQFQNQQLQLKDQFIASENNHNFLFPSSCINYPTTATTSSFSQTLASHEFAKQTQEIDAYSSLQNGRLKLALQEQSHQQLAFLLKKFEEKAAIILRHKEEEISQAKTRSTELHQLVKRLEAQNQLWQSAAAENQAMITSLNNTIEQLTRIPAQSCCSFEDRSLALGGGMTAAAACRRCNRRESSVVLLPCRHLCSCKECEGFLRDCPVCKSVKQATLEVLFS